MRTSCPWLLRSHFTRSQKAGSSSTTRMVAMLLIPLACQQPAVSEDMMEKSSASDMFRWWRWRVSNPRPAAYESAALPTELHRQTELARTREPVALCGGPVAEQP